ncbi:unnamed protein product [Rhizoctonia solani]|uniref:F-box domain-containing protein n=1 Tax=Rhizoctonia solani TaxID=456999 RepID=A0A8H3H6U6_9AGAM|nr:unnamed protein product [Rhizoctonia solani]
MGSVTLPLEIIYSIAQILTNHSKSILSLCVVNKEIYYGLCALLYRSVWLSSTDSVISFCDIVTSPETRRSTYVIALQIGPDWCVDGENFRLSREVAPQLRRALYNLHNLKHLSLATSPGTLNILLSDLSVSFKLDTFIHSGRLSMPMLRFLEAQPSMTSLGWYGTMTEIELHSLTISLKENLTLLPKLEAIEGPLYIIRVLIPLRPISRVTTSIRKSGRGRPYVATFIDMIRHTMVPVTRLCIVNDDPMGPMAVKLLKALPGTSAFSDLKDLQMVNLFNPNKNYNHLKIEDTFLDNVPFYFLRFNALEKFEFSYALGTRHTPLLEDIRTWLRVHEMDQLSHWRALSPSMRTVIFCGHVID